MYLEPAQDGILGKDIKITIAGKGSECKILYREGIVIEERLGQEGNTNISKGINPKLCLCAIISDVFNFYFSSLSFLFICFCLQSPI